MIDMFGEKGERRSLIIHYSSTTLALSAYYRRAKDLLAHVYALRFSIVTFYNINLWLGHRENKNR